MGSPILLLTYKNHALYEFSNAILRNRMLKEPGMFWRIGSQSKDEKMERYSLRRFLNSKQKTSEFERQVSVEIDELNNKISAGFKNFRKFHEKPLHTDVVLKFFDSFQLANLIRGQFTEQDFKTRLQFSGSVELLGEVVYNHLESKRHYQSIH